MGIACFYFLFTSYSNYSSYIQIPVTKFPSSPKISDSPNCHSRKFRSGAEKFIGNLFNGSSIRLNALFLARLMFRFWLFSLSFPIILCHSRLSLVIPVKTGIQNIISSARSDLFPLLRFISFRSAPPQGLTSLVIPKIENRKWEMRNEKWERGTLF